MDIVKKTVPPANHKLTTTVPSRAASVPPRSSRPYIEPMPMTDIPDTPHSRSLTPIRMRISSRVRNNNKKNAPQIHPPTPEQKEMTAKLNAHSHTNPSLISRPLKKQSKNLVLYFDTETTGLPYYEYTKKFKPFSQQPYITQLSYVLFDCETYDIITIGNAYIRLNNPHLVTPFITGKTGITPEMCGPDATNIVDVLCPFIRAWSQCHRIVGHNIEFDLILVTNDILRNMDAILKKEPELKQYIAHFMTYRTEFLKPYELRDYTVLPKVTFCTMKTTTSFCGLKRMNGLPKWPRLEELYRILFREDPPQPLHNSMIDTLVTMRCYLKYALNMDIHNVKFNHMVKKGTALAAITTPTN